MKMNKRNARITLVVMAALLIFLAYVSAFGIGSAGTGAAKNIILGLDLSGGVSVTYHCIRYRCNSRHSQRSQLQMLPRLSLSAPA